MTTDIVGEGGGMSQAMGASVPDRAGGPTDPNPQAVSAKGAHPSRGDQYCPECEGALIDGSHHPACKRGMLVSEIIGALRGEQHRLDGEDYIMDTNDCIELIKERFVEVQAATAEVVALFDRLRVIRQRDVQALGAALSYRNLQSVEAAYNSLRDNIDRLLIDAGRYHG